MGVLLGVHSALTTLTGRQRGVELLHQHHALVVELADTLASNSSATACGFDSHREHLTNETDWFIIDTYAAFVYRLGHSPFKARRRVRFPQAV
jgi:hypothetical protein